MITFDDVKVFLNDYPEANQLLDGSEFTPGRINAAIHYVIEEWNTTPPDTRKYTESNFPYKNTLLYGVAAFLFAGQSAFKERNHLTYNSSGLTIDDDNQSPTYLNLYRLFHERYTYLMEKQKQNENISLGWSIIESGYYP